MLAAADAVCMTDSLLTIQRNTDPSAKAIKNSIFSNIEDEIYIVVYYQ